MVELIIIFLLLITVVTPVLYFAGERRRTRKLVKEIERARHQAEAMAVAEEQESSSGDKEQRGSRRAVTFVDGKFDFHELDRDDGEKPDKDPRKNFK